MVRRHAVDIGWTFSGSNMLDWDCNDNVQCVLNNYLSYFSGGSSGIPLMHAVRGGTAGVLPSDVASLLFLGSVVRTLPRRLLQLPVRKGVRCSLLWLKIWRFFAGL